MRHWCAALLAARCCGGAVVRRAFAFRAGAAASAVLRPRSAAAIDAGRTVDTGRTGLLLLPPAQPLRNKYTLVRSGQTQCEAAGVIETNAAFKTAVSNGLTDLGLEQASNAADAISRVSPEPLIWHGTSRGAAQTAEQIAARLGVSSARVMPEYTLLDARGFGVHEGEALESVPQLHAAYDEKSRYLRPIEGEDGAYADSVEDVFSRVRQVLSIIETRLCGEDVVIVASGSDTLSIAHAALQGLDLRRHAELAFAFGEVRYVGDFPDAEPWGFVSSDEPGERWAVAERALLEARRADAKQLRRDVRWANEEADRDASDVRKKVVARDKRAAGALLPDAPTPPSVYAFAAVGVAGLFGAVLSQGRTDAAQTATVPRDAGRRRSAAALLDVSAPPPPPVARAAPVPRRPPVAVEQPLVEAAAVRAGGGGADTQAAQCDDADDAWLRNIAGIVAENTATKMKRPDVEL
ncbi:hypothetical protein M885DRAFT_469902 [Pelagophyceae sp. CCMP2097]|nr:hypothetical protein M885DRAFT_469902 [Pelagophyceae sp. CCMP2097]